ncbi:MAG: right-handed parallel beta-helix repeat-containing protein [Thermoguttaceae bacterium]|nr:right-handed parallel beta-helix repeat-containing protein [Thermoguttaceae bacterium]
MRLFSFAFGLALALVMIQTSSIFATDAQTFRLQPGKSFQQAIDEIRQWRLANPAKAAQNVKLVVDPGSYFFDDAVTLGPADSNLTIVASGKVVFTRGRVITGWTKNTKGHFVTHIPEVASGSWWFDQLYVNHERATRAKSPNQFYYYIGSEVESAFDPIAGKEVPTSRRAFQPRPENVDLFKTIANRAGAASPLNDVQIRFFHSWASSKHRIQNYDAKTNTVLLTGDARWTLSYWGNGKLRYEIEGVPEALDAPGEFLLSRNGTLEYIPRPGETLETSRFVAPDGPKTFDHAGFLRIVGDVDGIKLDKKLSPDSPKLVQNISIEGIRFTCDPFTLPPEGLSSGQAATNLPSAIYVEAARNITLQKCKISHTGGYAIWFHRACQSCLVQSCWMDDMAGGGMRIGTHLNGDNLAAELITRRVRVIDNIIHGYGRIEASAIGIWIGHAADNEILHNEICDGFYTGISAGWVWGYSPSPATGNKIKFNHIHDIGQGVLSDMGGFYSLGISPGTVVANNVIHDVYSYNRYGRGGWGLYTDEGSSNIVFENNLVYRVHTGTIHQHYGKDNVFRNNILALSLDGQLIRSRNETHRSFTIANNIILWDQGPLLSKGFAASNTRFLLKDNLYWFSGKAETDEEKEAKFFLGKTLAQWQQQGSDLGSRLADPGFVDPQHGDFHFRTPLNGQNPAWKDIFVPFDYSKAGLTAEAKTVWGDPANMFTMPTVTLALDAPDPPPLKISDRFETVRDNPFGHGRLSQPVKQFWTLKVMLLNSQRQCEKVLLDKKDMVFPYPSWIDCDWLGFCAMGTNQAKIDLDNISIVETPTPKKENENSFALNESFDKLAALPAKNLVTSGENIANAFELLAEGTDKFLRLNDSSEFKAMYNPHCFYRFKPLANHATVSYDLRFTSGAKFHTEARQYVSGKKYQYLCGPSLLIDDNKLRDTTGTLATLPPNRWLRFQWEFACGDSRVRPPHEIVEENGNRFLRLNDFALYPQAFLPSIDIHPAYTENVMRCSFKMRLSKDARFHIDGRDTASPYRNGFTMSFADQQARIGGRNLCSLEPDRWYSVCMRVPLGTNPNRKWSFTLTDCQTNKVVGQADDLPLQNKTWSALQWIVFYGAGKLKATIDLDDFELENVKDR